MIARRDLLKTSALFGFGALCGSIPSLAAVPASAASPRFIFLRKSNGTFPTWLVPPSLSEAEKKKEDAKEALQLDLSKHELPGWMNPIVAHKKNMTILQGLSAKMCTMGHSTYQSPLGVCRSAERPDTIRRATVDIELGRMFTSPLEHIELTCAHNQMGVVQGMSSIGPQQPNYAFASPRAAFDNLFLLASDNKEKQLDQALDNNLYEFLSKSIADTSARVAQGSPERVKLEHYSKSLDDLERRNGRLKSMAAQIKRFAPKLTPDALADKYTVLEQQQAFAQILLSSLYAGLSNVITFSLDDLGTIYTGLYEFPINLHDVGHNKVTNGVAALDVRTKQQTHHMTIVDTLVRGLKQMPEGNGSMFDNTVITYFPENGETHHSIGTEVPLLILAGDNLKLNIAGQYIRLPNYNEPGHKTLGNWYTTLLNAYGNPIKHYGDPDVGLKIDQFGPIRQFMA